MVTPPFRWGIVGFGWVARDYALPAMRAAGATLAAVHDPDPEAQRAASVQAPEAIRHPTLASLLAATDVDAIYVATPNHRHRGPVVQALAGGWPVLCEKPVAHTLADAEAIAEAAHGAIYGTAFDQRFHPAHLALRDLIRAGRLGTVTAIRIVYACWVGPEWSRTGSADGNWRADPARAGGGALIDLAPHGLDLAQFMLDDGLADIAALTQRRVQPYAVDDGAMLVVRSEAGVLVQLHVAYNCLETLPRRRLEIIGTLGQAVAENTMGQDSGGTLVVTDAATGKTQAVPFTTESPFAGQMAAFARFARGSAGEGFDIVRDLHTMRLLHRAYGSDPACR
jgi:1,5-anhydro-D-fructose reductase (1,5-anhydro-D-mannitol-forming)